MDGNRQQVPGLLKIWRVEPSVNHSVDRAEDRLTPRVGRAAPRAVEAHRGAQLEAPCALTPCDLERFQERGLGAPLVWRGLLEEKLAPRRCSSARNSPSPRSARASPFATAASPPRSVRAAGERRPGWRAAGSPTAARRSTRRARCPPSTGPIPLALAPCATAQPRMIMPSASQSVKPCSR